MALTPRTVAGAVAAAGLVLALVAIDASLPAAAAAAAVVLALAGRRMGPGRLDVAAVAMAATWGISALLSPLGASVSAPLACVVVTWGVARADARIARVLLAGGLSISVIVLALVALVALRQEGALRAESYPGLADWGGYPEIGLLGVLVVPLTVAVALGGHDRMVRISAAAAALASGMGLMLSGARAAWVAALVGVLVVLGFGRLRRGLLVLGVVAGLVAVIAAESPRLPSQAAALFSRTANLPVGARVEAWSRAAELWRARPIVGWGPATYGRAFRQQFGPSAVDARFHAHNQVLQMAAETGLVGASAGIALGLVVLSAAARRLGLPQRTGVRIGLFGGLLAVALRMLVDYFDPAGAGARVLIVVAVMAGLAVNLSHDAPQADDPS